MSAGSSQPADTRIETIREAWAPQYGSTPEETYDLTAAAIIQAEAALAAVAAELAALRQALEQIAGLRVASPYGVRLDAGQARTIARQALAGSVATTPAEPTT